MYFVFMQTNKDKLEIACSKLRPLTSLNQDEYDSLLEKFDLLMTKKVSLCNLKGEYRLFKQEKEHGSSSLYGSRIKLAFILMYLKENPNQSYHGAFFGMSQSKVSEWVSYILPVLEEALIKMKVMPQTGTDFIEEDIQSTCLLVDVTERQVPRDVDYENQKEAYSGKKKLHTTKNLAITDEHARLLFVSESEYGSVHDKSIWDSISFTFKDKNLLADLGFVGIDKDNLNVILPYKKPKNGELTALQKEINHKIGALRVRVEHAFSGVKRLKIIREKVRLKTYEVRDQVFRIAAALHNLRVEFRTVQKFS